MMVKSFQNFINSLAQHQEITDCCVSLYEQLAINPNVLLFCCWYGASGAGIIERADLLKTIFVLNKWHNEITLGLRKISLQLSQQPDNQWVFQLNTGFKKAEQIAEQTEQNLLVSLLKSRQITVHASDRIKDAKTNIATYLKLLNRQLQQKHYQYLSQLLELIFTFVDR